MKEDTRFRPRWLERRTSRLESTSYVPSYGLLESLSFVFEGSKGESHVFVPRGDLVPKRRDGNNKKRKRRMKVSKKGHVDDVLDVRSKGIHWNPKETELFAITFPRPVDSEGRTSRRDVSSSDARFGTATSRASHPDASYAFASPFHRREREIFGRNRALHPTRRRFASRFHVETRSMQTSCTSFVARKGFHACFDGSLRTPCFPFRNDVERDATLQEREGKESMAMQHVNESATANVRSTRAGMVGALHSNRNRRRCKESRRGFRSKKRTCEEMVRFSPPPCRSRVLSTTDAIQFAHVPEMLRKKSKLMRRHSSSRSGSVFST